MTNLFILQSVIADEHSAEAVSTRVFSTRDRAIKAFRDQWIEWNKNLGPNEPEYRVDVDQMVKDLDEDGYVEAFDTGYSLMSYRLDSDKAI